MTEAETVIFFVPPPCMAAFSSRLVNTWQMSTASIGTKSTSSGSSMRTPMSGKSRRNLPTASATTSSTASGDFWMEALSPPTRVMERRFSTMRMSHWESSLMLSRSSRRLSSGRDSFSSSTAAEPAMEVSGVRRSWETARRRSARILARSLSRRSLSCFLTTVVRALVLIDTASMVAKVSG